MRYRVQFTDGSEKVVVATDVTTDDGCVKFYDSGGNVAFIASLRQVQYIQNEG